MKLYLNILNYSYKFNLEMLIWLISGFCSLYFRFDGKIYVSTYLKVVPSALILSLLYLLISSADKKIFGQAKNTTYEELFSIIRCYITTGFSFFLFLLIYPNFILPKSFPILATILALGLHLICRKILLYVIQRSAIRSNIVPVALYGAGTQAVSLLNKILSDDNLDWKPVVILDDDLKLTINSINGVKVVKGLSIKELISKYRPKILIVTFANISNTRLDELQNICDSLFVELKIISPIKALSGQDFRLTDIRTPTQEELIGKSSIKIELKQVKELIAGKVILVTGAGGSIGSELARQIDRLNPKKLYLLDRDESNLLDTYLDLNNSSYILADIRDQVAISNILRSIKPEILVHAAALKHLNMLEKFPDEAIKTNIYGTNLLLEEASSIGIKTFINISTDKAADPISVLGKTKLISERLTAFYANKFNNAGTKFVSVRFGNVFGSRGSVIQTFKKQIDSGRTINITHPDVSRYFMTMEEAVYLVLRATTEGESGDTLILKMGKPILIHDIAKKLIRSSGKAVKVKYTGLKPGEKLSETLVGTQEISFDTKIEGIFRVKTEPISPSALPLEVEKIKKLRY
jgi:FlaA1/EpsC-like NDP-sugar epimerase